MIEELSYYEKNKERMNKQALKWQKEHPWWRPYALARYRCLHGKYRRRIKFSMTMDDFKMLWFRDKAWLLKRPSIDRKNNNGDYVINNCRFIELSKNSYLGNKGIPCPQSKKEAIRNGFERRIIIQTTLDGELVTRWYAFLSEIQKETGIDYRNISACLHGKKKSIGGYKWILQNA